MLDRLARLVPARVARHAVPLAVVAGVVVLLCGVAVASLLSPSSVGLSAARVSQTTALPATLLSSGIDLKDSDHDGLPDVLENYVYGTNPNDWNSSGLSIPDGWLVQYGYDPLSPLTKDARGVAPPPDKLPPAYADGYPLKFTPPLSVYYDWNKPASYHPGVDDPWWRSLPHADPSQWDQTGTGIPSGWLLYYGLDPTHVDPDSVAPGSRGNLTIREAFEHDTNPLALSTTNNGLTDWEAIHVYHTDPSRFDTCRCGIADGWLLHYGLNPFDHNVSTQDPDQDGLTNLEEFQVSYNALRDQINASGFDVLYQKGFDPTNWNSTGTGLPDGWLVKYFADDPFDVDPNRVIARASDWPQVRNLHDAPDGYKPIPDFQMTVRDAYAYGRPSDWNESIDGTWWGGTNPQTGDTTGGGLPDVIKIRGWYINVTTDTGPDAKPKVELVHANPLRSDSAGSGLSDLEKYVGESDCGVKNGPLRHFPPIDPESLDTASSGLTDFEKVCGVVRGKMRYDLYNATTGSTGFDPTKADSAGDYMRDGPRLDYWDQTYKQYLSDPRYPWNESLYKTIFDWTDKQPRFAGMTHAQVLEQFRPDGDVGNSGIPNVLNPDPSAGLYIDAFHIQGVPRTHVFFPAGPKMDPSLYRFTPYASSEPRPALDPANPDTDGDGLPDWWEVKYGVWDPVLGGWNLDPSKADSFGNGVTDDKRNLVGDVVTWYSYDDHGGGDVERTAHTFDYNDMMAFLGGTNPNQLSTQGDGVPDGWKAFWGSRIVDQTYPNLVVARDPSIGSVALAHADEIEAQIASSSISPTANLKGAGWKTTGYVRFLNVSGCSGVEDAVKPYLQPGEQLAAVNPCYAGQALDGSDLKEARITGVYTMTYKTEAEMRTNPYMADTSGDGVPDAYKAYYAVRSPGGTLYPDPAQPEAGADPGSKGVGLSDGCRSNDDGRTCSIETFAVDGVTYGAGVDPHATDTDHDGITDNIELSVGLDPLDPSDVENFRNPNLDTDHDGIPDYQELTGWGQSAFGVTVRTDPKNPSTMNQGLLDGYHQDLVYTAAPATQAQRDVDARIEDWCSRGFAHTTRNTDGSPASGLQNVCGPGMSGRVTQDLLVSFLGVGDYGQAWGFEADLASTVQAPGGVTVPDGWLAYYGQNPKETAPDVAAYVLHRPSWWDEKTMGVWWCGGVPGEANAPTDRDADGLNDVTGEDPFPTLRANAYHYGNVTIDDPARVAAFVKAGVADVQQRAQAYCDGAGDPQFERAQAAAAVDANGVPTAQDHAQVAIVDDALPNGTNVTKGVAFDVVGRVVLDERVGRAPGGALLQGSDSDRVGVPNRTILVGAFGPDRGYVLGVGYTNDTGWFDVQANVSSGFTVDVPAGLVTLGAVNGTLDVHGDPGTLATGDSTNGQANTIVAWVTNTSPLAAPGAPTYGSYLAWLPDANGTSMARTTHATGFAVGDAIPIHVRSDTLFTSTVAPLVVNGQTLVGDLHLVDVSGAPLGDRNVHLRWTGADPAVDLSNVSTDHQGVVNVTNLGLEASVSRADQYALLASFASGDPDLNGTSNAFPVAVVDPTALDVHVDRTSATVGDTITLTGRLATVDVHLLDGGETGSVGLAGATVHVAVGGASTDARTDAQGAFTARLEVPGSLAAGSSDLAATYAGSDTEAPAEAHLAIAIQRTARLGDLSALEGPRSIQVALTGTLEDNAGQGFSGLVEAIGPGGELANGTSDDHGAFRLLVPLSRLPLGTSGVRVVFPGDADHAAAENLTQARVTSTTTLALAGAPAVLVRGGGFPLTATLLDDQGQPVPGVAIALSWRGDPVANLATDANGEVHVLVQSNATERPALASVGAEAIPQPTSVYQPSTAEGTVRVVQGTTLVFLPGSVERGDVAIGGALQDDEGHPLVAAPVNLTMGGQPLGTARTVHNGTFALSTTLPPGTPLGPLAVLATYAGTDQLAGASATATWHVRSPLVPAFTTLGPFVRGEDAPVAGAILDDEGHGADALLRATLAGRDVGVVRAGGGVVRARLAVPADLPPGPAVLSLTLNATDDYEAFHQDYNVFVKIRPRISVVLPGVAIRGFSFTGDVTLRDDAGQPLRNASFIYQVGRDGSPTLGQTDADGHATLASVAPLAGDATLVLSVSGSDGVLPTQYTSQALTVVGPATPVAWVAFLLVVLAILALVALVVLATILRRRQLQEVREILDEAIRDLLAGSEYAGTIFLAYRKLSALLAKQGFAEQASQTPREFALAVRKALPISATPLRQLIGLFEEAKYSDHPVGSRERDAAVQDLTLVRTELDRLIGARSQPGAGG